MAKILIVYGTTEGHTATIAEHMGSAIAERGHEVTVKRLTRPLPKIPEDVDGVLVGASIHAEKHQIAVRDFARSNRDHLDAIPSGFFQVCLAAADRSSESEAQTQAIIDKFAESTGWRPVTTATFAGMLAWTRYGFFTRLLMKFILRNKPLSPAARDTSRDFDYTNYEAVRRFAVEFADSLA